jgi:uncharacterized protein
MAKACVICLRSFYMRINACRGYALNKISLNRYMKCHKLSTLSHRLLELIILPTEACNFRCAYCYESFTNEMMQRDVVEGIKSLLKHRSSDLSALRLIWFGGEPLLSKDIIFELSEYAQTLCMKHDIMFLRGHLSTNGYNLSLSVAKELVRLNQSDFQISLDGTKIHHDKTRHLISGKGTFNRIFKNIINIKSSDLDINILLRLHLMPNNVADIENLIGVLSNTLNGDPRFKILLKPVSDLGGPKTGCISTLDKNDTDSAILQVQSKMNSLPKNMKLKTVSIDEDYVCYAARPNSLMVRTDGSIGKCTVALRSIYNCIGQLHKDGSMDINNSLIKLWGRGYATMNRNELACPLQDFPIFPNIK